MKIVVNRSRGINCGYKLSTIACELLKVDEPHSYYCYEDRTLPELIHAVEFLQERVNGEGADLRVLTVPDDLETTDEMGRVVRHWHLSERDGYEVIRENHRVW